MNDEGALITSLLYIIFIWQFLYFGLLVYASFKLFNSEIKVSKDQVKKIQLINFNINLMNAICSLPIFQICLSFIICNAQMSKNFTCFERIYFLHFSIALISLLFHISNSFLYYLFYSNPNPFSLNPFAVPFNRQAFIRPALKFILPLYSILAIDVTVFFNIL